VALDVKDAKEAHDISVANGAISKLTPKVIVESASRTTQTVAEIQLFGDTVIRFVSGNYVGQVMPNYVSVPNPKPNINRSIGIDRIDHVVSNVLELFPAVEYLTKALGLHEFGEFSADDVGTIDSGLNSMVLANNNEYVLLSVNEPTYGTKRKSQIESYLEQHNGPGIQHIALKTNNIFQTVREMQERSYCGGFDFMPPPAKSYYSNLKASIDDERVVSMIPELQDMGILVDQDDQGIILQIFTAPISDRNTCWIEIIQR
jgi:4-hydroxyphenylpyruvate dioxygenase